MSSLFKPGLLFIAFGLLVGATYAQENDQEKNGNKTIIIRPDKNNREKYTIVVEGDQITVNGKPVDEFKGDGLTVIQGNRAPRMGTLLPSPPRGGWNMLRPEGMVMGNRALLGVVTEKADEGVRIKELSKESAAEKAGLKEGDILLMINDTKIKSPEDLYQIIGMYKPEDKISIKYSREGKEYTTTATLAKNTTGANFPGMFLFDRKNLDHNNFDRNNIDRNYLAPLKPVPGRRIFGIESGRKPKLGLQIQDTENGKGVKVLDVTQAGAAFDAGLKPDDIITAINGKTVNSVAEVRKVLSNSEKEFGSSNESGNSKKEMGSSNVPDEIHITYLRNNKTMTTTIKPPKKLERADL